MFYISFWVILLHKSRVHCGSWHHKILNMPHPKIIWSDNWYSQCRRFMIMATSGLFSCRIFRNFVNYSNIELELFLGIPLSYLNAFFINIYVFLENFNGYDKYNMLLECSFGRHPIRFFFTLFCWWKPFTISSSLFQSALPPINCFPHCENFQLFFLLLCVHVKNDLLRGLHGRTQRKAISCQKR